MSSKAVELVRAAERGDRISAIREAMGLGGEEFAVAVNKAGAALGFELGYEKSKVSRLESGKVTYFTAEEAVAIATIDPAKRGIEWLVLGPKKRASEPRERKVG